MPYGRWWTTQAVACSGSVKRSVGPWQSHCPRLSYCDISQKHGSAVPTVSDLQPSSCRSPAFSTKALAHKLQYLERPCRSLYLCSTYMVESVWAGSTSVSKNLLELCGSSVQRKCSGFELSNQGFVYCKDYDDSRFPELRNM